MQIDAGTRSVIGSLALLLGAAANAATPLQMDAFAERVVAAHGLDRAWVRQLLDAAEVKQAVRDAFKRTAESKTWAEYRPIFVTEKRARAGRAFAATHAAALARAEQKYGVPAAIIGAIIGVETFYGTYTGKYRVLDSLVSLAFHDWRRADFFGRELEEFLLLARDGHVQPRTVKGSYAGAMGLPQFIASSYRAYAVDFDGDGRRDLLNSPDDAIGSVAAYLSRHGWQAGLPVAARSQVRLPAGLAPHRRNKPPRAALGTVRAAGFNGFAGVPPAAPAMVVELNGEDGVEQWVALQNFHVITRYNHSPLYAMAVHQLAELLARTP